MEQLSGSFSHAPSLQCQLLNKLGELYRSNHQLERAIELHTLVLHQASQIQEPIEIARANLNLGNDYLLDRQFEVASQHGLSAVVQYEKLGLLGKERAATLNLLGTVARRQNHLEEAARYLQEAAAIWQELKQWPELARTLHNLSLVFQAQQRIDEAVHCLNQAKSALTNTSSEIDLALLYIAEGALYFERGQYDHAENAWQNIDLNYLLQSGHDFYRAFALNNLGNLAFVRGNLLKAENLLQASIDLWQLLAEPIEMANSLGKLGDVFFKQDRLIEAKAQYQQALNLLVQFDSSGHHHGLKQALIEDLQRVDIAK